MENIKLQKEILKFIIENEDSLKKNLNILSVEFKNKGYAQEMIYKSLYLLAKDKKIEAASVNDEACLAYAPLVLLEKGKEEIKPWIQKNIFKILVVIGTITSIVAAIFGVLSFFK